MEVCRNMGFCGVFREVATREIYTGFISFLSLNPLQPCPYNHKYCQSFNGSSGDSLSGLHIFIWSDEQKPVDDHSILSAPYHPVMVQDSSTNYSTSHRAAKCPPEKLTKDLSINLPLDTGKSSVGATWSFEGSAGLTLLVPRFLTRFLPAVLFATSIYATLGCKDNIDGLVQDCSNSITNALELLQFCTKPSNYQHLM